jgi:hypothetical protein
MPFSGIIPTTKVALVMLDTFNVDLVIMSLGSAIVHELIVADQTLVTSLIIQLDQTKFDRRRWHT